MNMAHKHDPPRTGMQNMEMGHLYKKGRPHQAAKDVQHGYINIRGLTILRADSVGDVYAICRARSYHSPNTKWPSVEKH